MYGQECDLLAINLINRSQAARNVDLSAAHERFGLDFPSERPFESLLQPAAVHRLREVQARDAGCPAIPAAWHTWPIYNSPKLIDSLRTPKIGPPSLKIDCTWPIYGRYKPYIACTCPTVHRTEWLKPRLPKQWSTLHENAWEWLWSTVARNLNESTMKVRAFKPYNVKLFSTLQEELRGIDDDSHHHDDDGDGISRRDLAHKVIMVIRG